MKSFSLALRSRAKALNLSNSEVARRLGLSERRYSHYVTGNREPDLATLVKIAKVLMCSVDDLLTPPTSTAPKKLIAARIESSIQVLPDEELELVAVQLEALAVRRVNSSRRKKAN